MLTRRAFLGSTAAYAFAARTRPIREFAYSRSGRRWRLLLLFGLSVERRKAYYKQKWPCCAGTLLQSVADFPLNVFFQDAHGVYVNLYAGSELRWTPNGVPVKHHRAAAAVFHAFRAH